MADGRVEWAGRLDLIEEEITFATTAHIIRSGAVHTAKISSKPLQASGSSNRTNDTFDALTDRRVSLMGSDRRIGHFGSC